MIDACLITVSTTADQPKGLPGSFDSRGQTGIPLGLVPVSLAKLRW